MRNCFLFCGIVVAGMFLLNGPHAAAQTAVVPQPATQSENTVPIGERLLRITVDQSNLTHDLVVRRLDAHSRQEWHKVWKFKLSGPKPTHPIDFIIEEQDRDKSAHVLLKLTMNPEAGWPADGQLTLFVGEHPLDINHTPGDLMESQQFKYLIWVSSFKSAAHKRIRAVKTVVVTKNPLYELPNGSVYGTLSPRTDSSFVLNEGDSQASDDNNQRQKDTGDGQQGISHDKLVVFRMQQSTLVGPTIKK